jgi:hypothetical protein
MTARARRRQPLSEGETYGTVPVPDPTKLTTDAVNAATAQWRRDLVELKDAIAHQIGAVSGTLTARLDAMDEAGGLRLAALAEVRPQTERQINHLRELHDERFRAIAQQFAERDVRGEQEKKAAKEALDAALLAQKESVSQQNDANTTAATKSETSFTKQIDQIGTLIATLEKSLTDRITELKERIDRGEGGTVGAAGARTEQRLNTGSVFGFVSAAVAVLALVVAVVVAFAK